MKLKATLLLIVSAVLIIASAHCAFATQYVFDENGVVIAEIEDTTSCYVFDENGVVIAEPSQAEEFDGKEDAEIAIIGGADGPTAIFVSGPSPFLFIALAVAVVAVIIILIILFKRRIKNK